MAAATQSPAKAERSTSTTASAGSIAGRAPTSASAAPGSPRRTGSPRAPSAECHGRKCIRCQARKAPERFPERGLPKSKGATPKITRRSSLCWACLETEAIELEARKAARRATWTDPKTGEVMRRCMDCGEVKRLYADYYLKAKPCPNSVHPASGPCKVCHDARMMAYRKAHPEATRARLRAAKKRHLDAVMSDPVRKAKLREDERLKRRLDAEAEGRRMRHIRPKVTQPVGPHRLPSEPLVGLVDRTVDRREAVAGLLADAEAATLGSVCADFGISMRTYHRWRSGEAAEANVGTVERILLNAGVEWSEIYSYDDYAAHFLADERVAP